MEPFGPTECFLALGQIFAMFCHIFDPYDAIIGLTSVPFALSLPHW